MRKISFAFALAALLVLRGLAFAAPIEKTFQLNRPTFDPETKKSLVQDLTAGFSKKAGGDLFTARIGPDKFRYEYNGEWIVFEPQGHAPALSASLSNELTYSGYWTDTDLRFTVRDYGVKVDIILKTDKAPTEFSFRISKSAGWQDGGISTAFVYSPEMMVAFYLVEVWDWDAGILTYSLPKEVEGMSYPLIIDPTFDLGSRIDDAEARRVASEADNGDNFALNPFTMFGHIKTGGIDYNSWNYTRFALNIPRASKITASNLSFKAAGANAVAFNTTVYGLLDDSTWRTSDGFGTYAHAVAINAIPHMNTSVAWNGVAAWTLNNWHDSPDISAIMQDMVDTVGGTSEYDPLDSEKKYAGLKVDDGDGAYGTNNVASTWGRRAPHSYDSAPADGAELDITFDPWGSVMVQGGFRTDVDGLRWYN
jgi:hypothetical protein